jgi:hypothetical protein
MKKAENVLGVDCGDVIFTSFGGVAIEGALPSLRAIVASKKFKEVHVVSKIDPITEYAYRTWLDVHSFWKFTGIPKENLHFCRRHEDKAPICEELGVTHFIDDRLRVLYALKSVPYRYALNPRPEDFEKYWSILPDVTVVGSWSEIKRLLDI